MGRNSKTTHSRSSLYALRPTLYGFLSRLGPGAGGNDLSGVRCQRVDFRLQVRGFLIYQAVIAFFAEGLRRVFPPLAAVDGICVAVPPEPPELGQNKGRHSARVPHFFDVHDFLLDQERPRGRTCRITLEFLVPCFLLDICCSLEAMPHWLERSHSRQYLHGTRRPMVRLLRILDISGPFQISSNDPLSRSPTSICSSNVLKHVRTRP